MFVRLIENFSSAKQWLHGVSAGAILLLASVLPHFAQAQEFLDPEVAFKVSATMVEPGLAEVKFTIAEGY